MQSSGCKSHPARAVAGRPVARVASGSGDRSGEAYTARQRAARVQLRNRFPVVVPTPLAWRKAASERPLRRGRDRTAGVPSPGHAVTGTAQEPGRAPDLLAKTRVWFTRTERTGPAAAGCAVAGAKRASNGRGTRRQGRPEASGMGQEQSYDPIVPLSVAKRRAPATGGHASHGREGGNKPTYRLTET